MTKKEIYQLMVLIQAYYENFQFDQHKLDAWHMVLQKYSYDKMHESLLKYVIDSPHAPKISDLVQRVREIPVMFVLDITAGEED